MRGTQRRIIDSIFFLEEIVDRAKHNNGVLSLRIDEVQEAAKLLDDIIFEEAEAFRAATAGEALLHFGFTESIERTIISSLLVAEKLALQDIALLPSIIAIAAAGKLPKRKVVEAIQGFIIFASNPLVKEALKEGVVLYAPHRNTLELVASETGDETLKQVADAYTTLQPTYTLTQVRRLFGRSGYLVDALIFSQVAGVESLSNDPKLRSELLAVSSRRQLEEAVARVLGGALPGPYSVVDLYTPLLEEIERVARTSKEVIVAEKLIVDPVSEALVHLKRGACREADDPSGCARRVVMEAHMEAFNRIVGMRRNGELEPSRIREIVGAVQSEDDLERAREEIIEMLIVRPKLSRLALVSAASLVSAAASIPETVEDLGNALVAASGASTSMTLSIDPIQLLVALASITALAATKSDLQTVTRFLGLVKKYVKRKVKAKLRDQFSRAVIQAYGISRSILS